MRFPRRAGTTFVPAAAAAEGDLRRAILACSDAVWGVASLRPRQLEVASSLLDPSRPNHVLACLRTGYGKSHIMRVLGSMVGGFTLVFIPLLALSADVLSKFQKADPRYGRVRVFHVDELYKDDKAKYDAFLQLCWSTRRSCPDTNFVFVSPHFLVRHDDALKALLHAAEEQTLRFVCMDEVHLHVQHGEAFRIECRLLTGAFFRVVFHPADRPCSMWFLGTSATIPHTYTCSIARLTTLSFPPRAVIRGVPEEFRQREIEMTQRACIGGDYVKAGLLDAVRHFQASDLGKVAIFTNSRYRSFVIAQALEKKIDEAELDRPVDLMHIHGALLSSEKFWRVRLFCHPPAPNELDANLRGLVGTAAVNVGIDDDLLNLIIRFEFPRDLLTAFQEQGRGSRRIGSPSKHILMYCLSSFEFIIGGCLKPSSDIEAPNTQAERQLEFVAATSALSPIADSARRRLDTTKSPTKTAKGTLTRAEKKRLKQRELRELTEVVQFYCLDLGCQQLRKEHYLSTGRLAAVPRGTEDCRTQCSICTMAWHQIHLPVYREGIVGFFQSSKGREVFPYESSKKSVVSSVLWGDHYWMERIFDVPQYKIKRSQVDALFLSLSATKILHIRRDGARVLWSLAWVDDDTPVYSLDVHWTGLNLFPKSRPRERRSVTPAAVSNMRQTMMTWLRTEDVHVPMDVDDS